MFARKRQAEPVIDDVEPAAAPAISGPAAKLMQMFGLSPEALTQTAAEVKAMVEDFRARLDRIEANQRELLTHLENATDPSRARARALSIEENERRPNGPG